GGNIPFHDLPLRNLQQFTHPAFDDASAISSNELTQRHPHLAPPHPSPASSSNGLARPHQQLTSSQPSPATRPASTSKRPKKLTLNTKAVAGDGARSGGSKPPPTSRHCTSEEKRARKIRMKEMKDKLETDEGLAIEQQSLLTEATEKLCSGLSLGKKEMEPAIKKEED
ncbi:MAG: hypothetical protein Q9181_003738, partial [Wetmoreana brouardii]